jgi:hypothetical protein
VSSSNYDNIELESACKQMEEEESDILVTEIIGDELIN